MYIWGITKKYKALSWWQNFMSGHISIGPVTIYGENAMHWAVNIYLKKRKTYFCFRLPFRCFGKWWPLYVYMSPNGTPSSATWKWGPRFKTEKRKYADANRH